MDMLLLYHRFCRDFMLTLTVEQELDIQIFESRLKFLSREELTEVAEMLYRNWMVRESLLKSMLGASL
jgi:hypothetical protein